MEENKTFTQDELNAIISERLKAERSKIMKDVQAKEAELTRRESMLNTSSDWKSRGLPVELLEMISPDKYDAAAEILQGYKKSEPARGGWGGGKNPDPAPRVLSQEEQIRQRMGLNRKDE